LDSSLYKQHTKEVAFSAKLYLHLLSLISSQNATKSVFSANFKAGQKKKREQSKGEDFIQVGHNKP